MTDNSVSDPFEEVIAELEGRIAEMANAIELLRGYQNSAKAAAAQGSIPRSALGARGGAPSFDHDAFFGMTVGDAARKYLSAIKKTASATALGQALVAGGWKTASKSVPETIRAILSRNDDFVKINGEFGLTEWYPGRKSGSKSKRASSAGADTMDESSSESEESSSEES